MDNGPSQARTNLSLSSMSTYGVWDVLLVVDKFTFRRSLPRHVHWKHFYNHHVLFTLLLQVPALFPPPNRLSPDQPPLPAAPPPTSTTTTTICLSLSGCCYFNKIIPEQLSTNVKCNDKAVQNNDGNGSGGDELKILLETSLIELGSWRQIARSSWQLAG